MSLPLEDAKSLELSSIRVSDNQLYVVIASSKSLQKWILANEQFFLTQISLWELFTSGATAEFKQNETFAYREFPDKKIEKVFIKNPLPITIALTPKTLTIYLQDYNTVYKTEETWVNLDKRDRYKTFSNLWINLKTKIAKKLGVEDYSYFDRLVDEIDDKFIQYYIRHEFRVLMEQIDYLGYLFCQNLPKTPEMPQPKFKVGDFIVSRTFEFPLKITKLNNGDGQIETIKADGYNDKDIYNIFPDGDATLFYKIPQFKVGDRIIYPTTQNGGSLGGSAKTLIEKATDEKLGYLVVTNVTYNRYLDEKFNYWLGFQKLPNASVSFDDEDNLKLYETTPEKPQPKFKIGDFVKEKKEDKIYKVFAVNLNKSTGRVDYGLRYAYADTLVYRKESDLETTEQPKFKRDDIVKYIADNGKKYKIEFITYQPDIYVAQLKQIGGAEVIGASEQDIELVVAVETPKDCEADASKIVSGQVKRFYDLNKTRIEKLKSEFSCKIIKALVSLSDYEKCGTPSKIKLPTAKEDLLSEIKNLKF